MWLPNRKPLISAHFFVAGVLDPFTVYLVRHVYCAPTPQITSEIRGLMYSRYSIRSTASVQVVELNPKLEVFLALASSIAHELSNTTSLA